MSGMPKKYRFLFSPYIFSLAMLLIVATLIAAAWLIIAAPVAGDRGVFVAFVLGIALLVLVPLLCSREAMGWYTITGESVTLHAPFRRPLTLRYQDVRCVGAGRSFLSVNYAYWLYLSMDPVPCEEFEDMRRFRLSDRGLRIAYSRNVLGALQDCLPDALARQLTHAETVLQGWGVRKA